MRAGPDGLVTRTLARVPTLAELREANRRVVETDLESIASRLATEFGQLAENGKAGSGNG